MYECSTVRYATHHLYFIFHGFLKDIRTHNLAYFIIDQIYMVRYC